MADIIAVSAYEAAVLMLESGLSESQAQRGINTIKQPSKGYYTVTDVLDYIHDIKKWRNNNI